MLVCCSVMKVKGQVRLRTRAIGGGGKSLYLDIYERGLRRYEYLRLYLVAERTPEDRQKNSETMRLAEAIAARRMLEVQTKGAALGIPSGKTVSVLLGEWLASRKGRSEGTLEMWRCWVGRVRAWKGCAVPLKDLTPEWWLRYAEWVRGLDLHPTTKHHYLSRMRCVLNKAEREGELALNPAKTAQIPALRRTERTYLTAEELGQMKAVSCPNTEIGRAFLFACFTGLRYSDIKALRWEQVEGRRLVVKIRKTQRTEYVELNGQAQEVLGERGSGSVFSLPSQLSVVERNLRRWAEAAGVQKHITFHASRHTFAVLMLSAGVDIYTLSRLLGHSSVTTTQIYADIVDARRRAAVDMFPKI